MDTTHTTAEVLIPDEVIDDRFRVGSDARRTAWTVVDADPTPASRRQKLGAALLLVVLTVVVVGVASMVLVGAFIVAAVLFVVGLAARLSSGLRRVGRRDHGIAPR